MAGELLAVVGMCNETNRLVQVRRHRNCQARKLNGCSPSESLGFIFVLCCVFVYVFIFVLPVPRDMQAYDVPVDPMFLAEPRPSTVSTAAAEELLDVSTMYHNKTFRAVSNDANG